MPVEPDVDGGTPATPVPPPATSADDPALGRLGYLPAIDGLRAVAVLAVMAFHAGFPSARGGMLGVSTFFTLSGFLIATLVIAEWTRTGRLSLARFWERRARRLLPAALVALAAVAVLQAVLRAGSAATFRNDLLSTLVYGTNWRLAARGGDYATLFAEPSPVTHFWSLAIEEQFYLLFPLAFLAVTALTRRRLRRTTAVFAVLTAASFGVAAVLAARYGNGGLAYYGTHTRAGEILVGVVLAFLFADRRVRAALRSAAGRVVVRYGAVAALGGLAWLWHTTTLGSPSLFRGIVLLNALLTAWVILATTTPGGPTGTLLGNWPLRSLGKVSYAAYLFHWPVFLVLDEQRLDLSARPLFAVRVAVTVGAAAVSYHLVEQPFRRGLRNVSRPRLATMLAGGAVAVTALVLVLPVHQSEQLPIDLAAERSFDGEDYQFNTRDADVVDPEPGGTNVADVLLVGDSLPWSLLPGLAQWNIDRPDRSITVDTHLAFGCPLTGPGRWRGPGGVTDTYADCETWLADIPRAMERSQPDVTVIAMGLGDVGGRAVEGEWRHFGDPAFDDWFRRRVDTVADALAASGAPVVWLTYPDVRLRDPGDPTADVSEMPVNDPARMDALNEAVRDVVGERPGFRVADLSSWVRAWPGGQFDPDHRDGVHFTLRGSQYGAAWVVPQVLAAATDAPPPTAPVPPPPS